MSRNILILPGDGIGPEITAEAVKILEAARSEGLDITLSEGKVGGAGYDAAGHPLPAETLEAA
ncbi:isocitrate/isopropylmalate family dehydrogenase, partial [Cobetia sp.]